MIGRAALAGVLTGWMAVLSATAAGCGAPVMTAAPISTPAVVSSPIVTPAATPPLDLVAVRARLQRAATLEAAARQCAAAAGETAQAVRVRVETAREQECVPCNRLPIGTMDRGLPVESVQLPIAPNSWVWLSAGDLLCVYGYDGAEFTPAAVMSR